MARISGVDLPRDKKVEIGLTYIFGVGRATAREILEKTGVNTALRVRDLTDADVNRLRQAIEKGAKEVTQITKDASLDPLRSRVDFQELLAQLEAKNKP